MNGNVRRRTTRRRPGRPVGGGLPLDRDGLLDAAERTIRRLGPTASLDDIATEVGVTKPVLYARLGGKPELVHALAERLVDRIAAAVVAAVAGLPPGREALRAFLGAQLATVALDRDLYVYVTSGAAGDEGPDRILHLAGRSAGPIAEQLAAGQPERYPSAHAALPAGYAIIGMLHLASLWWLRDPDRSADELTDQLADLLWHGLGP